MIKGKHKPVTSTVKSAKIFFLRESGRELKKSPPLFSQP